MPLREEVRKSGLKRGNPVGSFPLSYGIEIFSEGSTFNFMSVKDLARKTIEELPEDADWEEVIERITLSSAISRGLSELDSGKGIPVEDVEKDLEEWLNE